MRKSSSLSRAHIGAWTMDPAVTIVALNHHAALRLLAVQTVDGDSEREQMSAPGYERRLPHSIKPPTQIGAVGKGART